MDEPERPPLHGFFARMQRMASAAFLAVPFAGPYLADVLNRVLIPTLTPFRNRLVGALLRPFTPAARAPRGRARP